MFDFGDDLFGNTSDVDQPTVCVHIQYGTCLIGSLIWWCVWKLFMFWWSANEGACYWWFYFGDVFGSYSYLGDMQMRGEFVLVTCMEAIYILVTCKWRHLLLVMCMENTNKIAKLKTLIVSGVLGKCLFLVTWSEVCLFKWCVWECKWC